MRSLPLFALLLAALPAAAQQSAKPEMKFENKARKLAEKDKDFQRLDPDEQQLVIAAVAKKLMIARAYNRKLGKQKMKVDKVDIKFVLADSDLETLYAKNPSLKKKNIVHEKETSAPGKDAVVTAPPSFETKEIEGEPFHSLFKDNEWTLQEDSCEAGQLRMLVEDAVSEAGPNGTITGILVQASASALRNTGAAKDLSWRELSSRRADEAQKFVVKILGEKGIKIAPDAVILDYDGENGDGTSGPRGPYPSDGNGNGQPPYGDVKEYGKHKFVNVVLYASVPVEKPGEKTVVPGAPEVKSELAYVSVGVKESCRWWRCWKLPSFHFEHKRKFKKYTGQCPRF